MTTKPAFSALGAPMSLAWVHGSPHVEDLALPKSLKSGNFTVAKAVIRRMSDKTNNGITVDHEVEKLLHLATLVEWGPDWNTIEQIRVILDPERRLYDCTVEGAGDSL